MDTACITLTAISPFPPARSFVARTSWSRATRFAASMAALCRSRAARSIRSGWRRHRSVDERVPTAPQAATEPASRCAETPTSMPPDTMGSSDFCRQRSRGNEVSSTQQWMELEKGEAAVCAQECAQPLIWLKTPAEEPRKAATAAIGAPQARTYAADVLSPRLQHDSGDDAAANACGFLKPPRPSPEGCRRRLRRSRRPARSTLTQPRVAQALPPGPRPTHPAHRALRSHPVWRVARSGPAWSQPRGRGGF